MEKDPLISVVVATHNHAHFLPECLNSIKTQTYGNYELIVVDNGSTDNTKEVVESLSWNRLHYYYQSDTGSVAGPRNTAIKLAQGKYIAFLDSDDLWYQEKLQEVAKVLKDDPEIDILSHNLIQRKNGKIGPIMREGPVKKDMFKHLLTINCLAGSAAVVKRDILLEINGFDENKDFVHVEDYETWLRIAYRHGKFFFIDKVLGEYRVHDSNLSHDFKRALLNEINVVNKHLKNFKSRIPFHKEFIRSIPLSRIFLTMGMKYFSQGKYFKGLVNIVKSFFINPISLVRFLFLGFIKVLLKIKAFIVRKENLFT
ncbi:MAG: glycosyltransferase [Candidatus Omnitrophica bacterium]|jgi:glycosyltransferase involved in cell wall biosynthesis|nr:glycosyltransferase [Candidatus Omnitrophota bacterium]